MDPLVTKRNTLILSHKNLKNPKITDKLLLDNVIYEVTWDGKIVWEWLFSDHSKSWALPRNPRHTIPPSGLE